MDNVPAIYLLGARQPLQVEVRVAVCALSVKTFYTPLGRTSLEDSLCHSNNGLAGKHMIGGLRPWLDLAMAHWPQPSCPFWDSGHLWLLKIERGLGISATDTQAAVGLRGLIWWCEDLQ